LYHHDDEVISIEIDYYCLIAQNVIMEREGLEERWSGQHRDNKSGVHAINQIGVVEWSFGVWTLDDRYYHQRSVR